jgi:transposase
VWAFCPQKKSDHQGDYHKVFNGDNYIVWFRDQLLANLHQPSLIMLDNAAYHFVYGKGVPQWYRMKKQQCIDYLTAQSIEFDLAMVSAMETKQLIKAYIKAHVKIEVDQLAEEGGHTVLFTPAYHSDLLPIELVWAMVKGNVGRQYSNQTTLDMVYERLMHEFNQLEDKGHHSIYGMIEKCASLAAEFYAEMDAEDDMEEEDPDDASDNQSDFNQEDPPDPRSSANNGPGGDSGEEEGGSIGPFAMV